MKNAVLFFLLILSNAALCGNSKSYFEMPAIFSNNMVLQQKMKAPFWGKALPGSDVTIKASWGKTASTKAGNDSLWFTKIQTPKAGGPYQIKITVADSTFSFSNVLIGEVWLCSGQSNMEMPMEGWPPKDTIFGAQNEIKNGNDFNLRFFTVQRDYADKPKFTCNGEWLVSSPEAVAKFSATAFYFGRNLAEALKIPIGLIHTSWGGTAVESWMSKKYLGYIDEYKELVNKIDNSSAERKKLYDWLAQFPVIDMNAKSRLNKWTGLTFNDAECALPVFDDSKWKVMKLPGLWEESELGNFDGTVWFRKKIEIPGSWLHKELVVELGPIDDMDITFINGIKIGEHEADDSWDKERIYRLSAEKVTDTILTIAVRVVDNQGGGGLYGDKEKLNIHLNNSNEKISLAGEWKYLPVAEYRSGQFFVYGAAGEKYFQRPQIAVDFNANMPTALYNAMIAPLIPYSIKGAIWYQGESNAWKPGLYHSLFSSMITGWRNDWNEGAFPFYFVQIAPFNYGDNIESQRLREAQMQTLSVPNTGMAVTLDIGNPVNVHPGNKADVGGRLAAWALAKDYHKKVFYSGPLYKSKKIVNDKIILSFDYADGGLVIKENNNGAKFLLAGEDKVFKPANVKNDGKNLVLSSPEIQQPVSVRYAWDNTSGAILFNKKNFPASSFRTDDWNK